MADYSVPVDRTYRPALPASSRIVGGAIAGLIAGILMGAAMTIYSAQINIGASTFWQSIAAMFYGPMAYVGDAGVTAIGVLTHLATAMTLGAFFGWI
ncbi:MAG TPA: hypothetical protein VFW83_03835, partial [Bryobacteraceae bacterium]|nr:hypothetical protein [Bryobacteraceae bacterium]